MPANFDNELIINEHGCISPQGPIELEPGEVCLRLDAWVAQPGGACMSHVVGPFDDKRWVTNPNPEVDHIGDRFVPGPARAFGITVNRRPDGTTIAQHWSEDIALKPSKEASLQAPFFGMGVAAAAIALASTTDMPMDRRGVLGMLGAAPFAAASLVK